MALDAGCDPRVYSARTPKRFILYRRQDATGVSGTGVVATGVVWPDGHAALRWKADDDEAASSTSVWSSVADMMRVHGHSGLSEIVYLDDDGRPPQAGAPERALGRVAGPWARPSH
jgi:hypothetical protein